MKKHLRLYDVTLLPTSSTSADDEDDDLNRSVPKLQVLCRTVIRRTIRYSKSPQGSVTGNQDKVLSLHTALPRRLVDFLLYRDVIFNQKIGDRQFRI